MSLFQPPVMLSMSEPTVAAAVLLLALAHCFAGYVLFRLNLLLDGLLVGAVIGVGLVESIRSNPSSMDVFVGGAVGAIILALLAWNLYRVVFSLGVGAAAYLAVSGLFGLPTTTVGAVLGAIVAIALAVYVYMRAKPLIMIITAIIGSAAACVCVISIFAGRWAHPYLLPEKSIAFLITAVVATALLAAAGFFVQKITSNLFSKRFSPDGDNVKRKLAGDIKLRVVK